MAVFRPYWLWERAEIWLFERGEGSEKPPHDQAPVF